MTRSCAASLLSLLLCRLVGFAAVGSNVADKWNAAELQGIRDTKLEAPMIARAMAIVHTCMYDAWAAYDEHAVGTQLHDAIRRPASERTLANKEQAVSYAAYRALADVLPVDTDSVYVPLMKQLGYDPNDNSTDIETPAGIGNVSCAAVLEFRHHDKSNQLGDLAQGAYSDWSNYRPVNAAGTIPATFVSGKPLNPEHWQPLTYTDSSGNLVLQMFAGAHWCYVTPFAMTTGDQFRSVLEPGPPRYGSAEYKKQAEELIALSAGLSDEQKTIVEYWSGGPDGEQSPSHWIEFARRVSERDHHTLDDDAKMFFALSNTLLDASIASWDAKRTYDSVRPITAIPLLFHGKNIHAWGGPGRGTVEMDGGKWIPYQPVTSPTPPFPEYVSETSAYGSAAAAILKLFTGSDRFDESVILPTGSSRIEPRTTPTHPVTLRLDTFTDAASQAGISRQYAGTSFRGSDLAGRVLGRAIASQAWAKAQGYFDGTVSRHTDRVALSSPTTFELPLE